MSAQPASALPGTEVSPGDAARLLSASSDVTLLAHVNPDADALGSALALGMALRRRGTMARVAFGAPEHAPASLADLDVEGLIVPASAVPAVPSTVVALDAGSLGRLGGLADRVDATIAAGGEVLVIDHHVGNTRFGTRHVIDEEAEATVLIVLDVLDELGADLDTPTARCLYAGLVTDTRSFRRARPSTHRTAARLLEAGVDPDATIRPLLDDHPFQWLGMLASSLSGATLEPAGARGLGFVHAAVPYSQWKSVRGEDVDSVIDILRTTSEAEVAAVFKEVGPGRWSVSLRADSAIDVSHAAAACGGGGHRLASGFTAEGHLEDLLARLRKALNEAPLLT